MKTLLKSLATCIEFGKANKKVAFPPHLKNQEGAEELTIQALKEGISPDTILKEGLVSAMNIVGEKFSKNEIFVPHMLMAARAMNVSMEILKPYFKSGQIQRKGVFVIGTVAGDLHDIGKNLISMMVEGAGWEVIDLGVDVDTEKFETSIINNPACIVGLSALLTTTMVNMEVTVKVLKEKYPNTKLLVGGAPVTEKFSVRIGADGYSADPQGVINYLKNIS